jgi:hypothetical protein
LKLVDQLLTVKEREDGGRTAFDRFDFQTAWGLTRVLRLHAEGVNYAVGFEFHDDIVELDDATSPTQAVFYQVKTKSSGNWTFDRVTERRTIRGTTKKNPSFAGKMFDSIGRFGTSAVRRLVFVSNQPMPDLGTEYGETPFLSAEEDRVKRFTTAMQIECPAFDTDKHLGYFHFHYCELNLGSYDHALYGRMGLFLAEQISVEANANAFTLFMVEQCRRRSKSVSDLQTFQQLLESKFITRADVAGWLEELKQRHEYRPNWETVARHLALPHNEEVRIEREWNNYIVQRRGRWNSATLDFSEQVKRVVEPVIDAETTLRAGMEKAFPLVRSLVEKWKPSATDEFVKAVTLYEYKR